MIAPERTDEKLVYSKLEVARRLIDAGVRLTFSQEEPVAIYAVVAAAHRILVDVMKQRGRNPLAEQWEHIAVGYARAIAANELDRVEQDRLGAETPWMLELANELSKAITTSLSDGKTLRTEEIVMADVSPAHYEQYKAEIARPANFLKHADRDARGHMTAEAFDSRELLFDACDFYLGLMKSVTPEMLVYTAYCMLASDGSVEGFPHPMRFILESLADIEPKARMAWCSSILSDPERHESLNQFIRKCSKHLRPSDNTEAG